MKRLVNVCEVCGIEIPENNFTNKITIDFGIRRVLWNSDTCPNCRNHLEQAVWLVINKGRDIKQLRIQASKAIDPVSLDFNQLELL